MIAVIIAFALVAVSICAAVYNTRLYLKYKTSSSIALGIALLCMISVVVIVVLQQLEYV